MTENDPDFALDDSRRDRMLALTTQIVAAHISRNAVPGPELPALIGQVFQTVTGLGTTPPATAAARPEPAVPVRKSVFADYIVCLEDGKKLRMLKRHLMASYGMTPDTYRERWGLPSDYPMVAPRYSERRSNPGQSHRFRQQTHQGGSERIDAHLAWAPGKNCCWCLARRRS